MCPRAVVQLSSLGTPLRGVEFLNIVGLFDFVELTEILVLNDDFAKSGTFTRKLHPPQGSKQVSWCSVSVHAHPVSKMGFSQF